MFAKYERHDIVIAERQERPPSGSFFAIKRHMMRDFKKDGHNWTKKKNGKTVQEANRILKVGNVKMLRCFYVHGQDNDNFQRRIYYMLQGPVDIALFHYLEVKRNRTRCEREKKDILDVINRRRVIVRPTMEWQV
ncbi:hypothetical protein Patl1_27215 [Pistacia atlantica]|uniref:Uncharacterized protein n=1 Tax=Pistacia atlantica TaxID=434234 RepID=A0ACC1BEK0_9ROSI|nr:hypothetical protein Patl1_27215 [Pistacia atlantica]